MRTWFLVVGLSLLAPSIAACDTAACTEIAVASVTLELVDAETGGPIVDALVTFTVDGGDAHSAESQTDGVYVLGYELEGSFNVQIDADGFEAREEVYDVDMDDEGCHVEGVSDTIMLAEI